MTTPQGAGAASGGNVFLRKLGPLPMWAWMGVGLGVALAISSWRKNKAAGAAASQQAAADTASAQDTPPFIIQNFDNDTPSSPVAPPSKTPVPPTKTPPPKPAPKPSFNFKAYKTKSGDTLASIAKKNHIDSAMDIMEASVQAEKAKPSTGLRKALEQLEKHGTTGRLPAGLTIYLPIKGHEQ